RRMDRGRHRPQGLLVARLGTMAGGKIRRNGRGAQAGFRQAEGARRRTGVICAGEERGLRGGENIFHPPLTSSLPGSTRQSRSPSSGVTLRENSGRKSVN